MEEWRPVVDLEDYYSVSNLGQVRKEAYEFMDTRNRCRKYPQKILDLVLWQGYRTSTQYFRVRLAHKIAELNKYDMVHKLVASAFLGPPNGREVLHIDGNPFNNKADNLMYGMHGIFYGLTEEQLELLSDKSLSASYLAEKLGATTRSIYRWREIMGVTPAKDKCSIEWCHSIMHAKGLCSTHYQAVKVSDANNKIRINIESN